jgi:hypothetical protein
MRSSALQDSEWAKSGRRDHEPNMTAARIIAFALDILGSTLWEVHHSVKKHA